MAVLKRNPAVCNESGSLHSHHEQLKEIAVVIHTAPLYTHTYTHDYYTHTHTNTLKGLFEGTRAALSLPRRLGLACIPLDWHVFNWQDKDSCAAGNWDRRWIGTPSVRLGNNHTSHVRARGVVSGTHSHITKVRTSLEPSGSHQAVLWIAEK